MKWLLPLAALLVAIGAIAAVERAGIPPRRLAPYLEHRASGHRPAIEGAARFAAGVLVALDRGGERFFCGAARPPQPTLGAFEDIERCRLAGG
ncbi:MAG: hypothetical protein ACM3JC_10390 [Rudaea sp.]